MVLIVKTKVLSTLEMDKEHSDSPGTLPEISPWRHWQNYHHSNHDEFWAENGRRNKFMLWNMLVLAVPCLCVTHGHVS